MRSRRAIGHQALAGWLQTQTHPDLAEPNANDRTVAAMKRQRVAMAVSAKAGQRQRKRTPWACQ